MKKCKSCQTEIDAKAKKCPHCQADQRNWFARHPIITGILILVLLAMVGSAIGGNKGGSSSATQANQQASASPTPASAQKITAKELADDFDANQVAAESKWKDKLVEFSATVSNITDSGISFTDVASKQFSMTQISCQIKDKSQLMPLKNGQTITVRGVVGAQTIGVIDLSQCEVVQ